MIIGEIIAFVVSDDYLTKGRIDISKLKPIYWDTKAKTICTVQEKVGAALSSWFKEKFEKIDPYLDAKLRESMSTDMLKVRNLNRKSLDEVVEKLKKTWLDLDNQ